MTGSVPYQSSAIRWSRSLLRITDREGIRHSRDHISNGHKLHPVQLTQKTVAECGDTPGPER